MIKMTLPPLLPYHPRFERRESLSSYIIRLANENGYYDLNLFLRMLFNTKVYLNDRLFKWLRNDFFPTDGFGNLPLFCGCTEEELKSTTLHYISDYFRKAEEDIYPLDEWAIRCLKKRFAYCPVCIKEYGCYSLFWRFNNNPGCSEHALKLVDKCYKCQSYLPLPLYHPNAKIGRCPLCEADLTRCPVEGLNSETLAKAQEFEAKVEYLISPHDRTDRYRYLNIVQPRFPRSILDYIDINYDKDLPEYQAFSEFRSYFETKVETDRSPAAARANSICTLFTFYWLSSSINELMELYLLHRDNPRYLSWNLVLWNQSTSRDKFFCRPKGSSSGNAELPCTFDLLPTDLASNRLRNLIIQMGRFVNGFQMDLYFDPEKLDRISSEVLDEIKNWQHEIQELRDLRNLEN